MVQQLMPAYRQELEENLIGNLPDQKNVALGGFVSSKENCRWRYTIAVLVVNRVSKLKLWNTMENI